MAEVIKLAEFDLDTKNLEKSLSNLQDNYFDLTKQQKEYAAQTKETQKQIDLLKKSQDLLTSSAGDNTEALQKNEKELNDLTQKEKDLFKAQQNNAVQMTAVRKEITQTNNILKDYQNTETKTTSLIDAGNAALNREIKTKNDAKAANIALNNVANQLNPNIEEEAKLLQELNDKMDANTKFVKENSSATAQQALNIGNYQEDVENALKAQEDFNGGIGGFILQSSKAGGAGNILSGAFSAIKTGILGALQAGIAFIATPIGATIAALALAVGAVVGAFKLAKASLQSTEEGTQKLAVVTGAITGVFKGFFKVLKPLGEFLANVFIGYLETVGKVAESVANGLANVLEFVGAESAAKGVRNFTKEVKESSIAAANLAKAENELTVQQRQATKVQLDYQKQAEKLRQQRDDETNSIAKRIQINSQLGEVLKKQSQSELAIANKALEVANLRIKADGKTTESLDKLAEAQTNISDIQERITGQESEQLANLNSLRKEAANAEKERQDQATEKALALSRSRIDAFIAEQGFKKKSAEEEYNFNKQLYDKEAADLKLQLQKKKISQAEYDAQLLQLRNDYLAKNAQLTIENAQLELDETLAKNQRILESDKFISEEQLALKKQALADDLAAQQEFEKIRLEQGQINQAEYNAAINAINEENRQANLELEQQRKEEDQARQLIDLENQKAINEENFLAQAEIEKAQNEIKRQQEVANAEQTGADISLINAKYAKMQEDIESAKQANKVQLASDAFGSLATIFGAESKAGKAAAIAQTTIDTYQSAVSAFKALSGIPIVGPVLGGIASAAAIASGLKAVKQITATKTPTVSKTPSYATGVIGLRGVGTGTSDQINLNASPGESIINAKSTSMFANELSAINQAGGGVGLNGASNVLTQNTIESNANNMQMAQMIAEAVAIGAEAGTSKGSEKGLTNLSDNRRVMSDAKF